MSGRNDGRPAFPSHPEHGPSTYGMSLRDYFAGQALAGDFSAQNESAGCIPTNFDDKLISDRVILFYRFADAMLAEREKGGDQ